MGHKPSCQQARRPERWGNRDRRQFVEVWLVRLFLFQSTKSDQANLGIDGRRRHAADSRRWRPRTASASSPLPTTTQPVETRCTSAEQNACKLQLHVRYLHLLLCMCNKYRYVMQDLKTLFSKAFTISRLQPSYASRWCCWTTRRGRGCRH
ncbi:hypothetical protein SORBI_3003G253350 [Sorghum bicolor]|uniref:Uncharacterized protein n=1 Tax=Sorghum bicolor TaxID=4558 RepID=A0A1W0VYX5_SORBI|nr:hypothetical protein SORBI_3003G253350 [Sorghum bicolor]